MCHYYLVTFSYAININGQKTIKCKTIKVYHDCDNLDVIEKKMHERFSTKYANLRILHIEDAIWLPCVNLTSPTV